MLLVGDKNNREYYAPSQKQGNAPVAQGRLIVTVPYTAIDHHDSYIL
jgi:hypothetical protein